VDVKNKTSAEKACARRNLETTGWGDLGRRRRWTVDGVVVKKKKRDRTSKGTKLRLKQRVGGSLLVKTAKKTAGQKQK